MTKSDSGAAAIDKVLDIAELVAEAPEGMTAAEIAERTGLPRPTVYRLLAALGRRGYLTTGPDRRIRIGLSFLRIGSRVHFVDALSEISRPLLWRTVKETGCSSAQIAVLNGSAAAFIERVTLPGTSFQLDRRPGDFVPLYCTALGKVLLAQLPPDEVSAMLELIELEKRTPATPVRPEAILAELEQVRRQGYAVSVAEYADDVWSVAAAVSRPATGAPMAIGISEHMWRYSPQKMQAVAHQVADAAAELGTALVARPASRPDDENGDVGFDETEGVS